MLVGNNVSRTNTGFQILDSGGTARDVFEFEYSGLGISLNPNTQYWFSVFAETDVDGFQFGWAGYVFDPSEGPHLGPTTGSAQGFFGFDWTVDHPITHDFSLLSTTLAGDFNMDGSVDDEDIDFYSGNLDRAAVGSLLQLDLNNDAGVTLADHDIHVTTLVETSNGVFGTFLGDINLDGNVDVLGDAFILVSNLSSLASVGWGDGDLNADGQIDVLGDAFRLIGNLGQSNTSSSP